MTDEVDPFIKRTVDEFDAVWETVAKVEITAIKASSESSTMAARLRTFEQKLMRAEAENADIRVILAQILQEALEPRHDSP